MPSLDMAHASRAVTNFLVELNADPGIECSGIGLMDQSRCAKLMWTSHTYIYGAAQEEKCRKIFLHYWEFDHVGTMNCMGERLGQP
jgi:hypothetical protein